MFKDIIAADTAVFISFDEFGEMASIDGGDILVVIDNDIINKRPRLFSTGSDPYYQGVYQSLTTFFVKSEDLGYMPVENQNMTFNRRICVVKSVSENMGILEITLESNQS